MLKVNYKVSSFKKKISRGKRMNCNTKIIKSLIWNSKNISFKICCQNKIMVNLKKLQKIINIFET